ncbi:Crp/Fnr family transcriptional regulator [Rhizobium sp. RU36D]|uniref:Crp/Fnr family transcriptional regulator n=1 Tax=Rhizobium sp. RU36D TaxID=1907415 RepID=UPI001FCD49A9|nr:Crp/Fnr family transcriptional regulator [Rhizobium sp. RU36D]
MTSIFASLSPADERQWLDRCRVRSISAGEALVDYEEPTTEVFVVQSGELRAVLRYAVGKEAILGTFRRGDVIGEVAAIDGLTRSANLMAVTDASVVVLPGTVFHDIMKQNFDVCMALMQLLAHRLRQTNERLSELTFLDTKHRLYNALLRLSRARSETTRERIISPPMVHADLAELIGASRETVSREMSRLSRDALVERTSRAIVLKNPAELSRRISKALEQ